MSNTAARTRKTARRRAIGGVALAATALGAAVVGIAPGQIGKVANAAPIAAAAPGQISAAGATTDTSVQTWGVSDSGLVVYSSQFDQLAPVAAGTSEVWVRNGTTGMPEKVSVGPGGVAANGGSGAADISSDGRWVVFTSGATNLTTPAPTTAESRLYVRDLQLGTTTLVPMPASVTAASLPSFSPNGNHIAYLALGASATVPGVYLANLAGGAWTSSLVTTTNVEQASFDRVSVDDAGRFVSYVGNIAGARDVYVHDTTAGPAGTATAVSGGTLTRYSNELSADGRKVLFESQDTIASAGDTDGQWDVFVKDLNTNAITLVSKNPTGTDGNGESKNPSMSSNGRYVAFTSWAEDLVTTVSPGLDVFVRDLTDGITALVPQPAGASDIYETRISGNGSKTAFTVQGATKAVFSSAVTLPSSPYVGLTPARLLDTRTGGATADGGGAGGGPLAAGSTIELQVTGRGGVPGDADAVVLNLTAAESSGPGFTTAYPCGTARPLASNLNYLAGQTTPNLAVVKVGVGGKVCLFAATSSVNLIGDVAGYFPAGSFTGRTPARLLDSRSVGATVDGGGVGGGPLAGGAITQLTVAGRGGVPADASAVVLNITATEASGPGYATAWPCSQPQPLASNLNYGAGDTVPNLVFVKLGAGEKVCLFTATASVNLIADVSGYVPNGAAFVGLNPARLLDSRPGGATADGVNAGGGTLAGGGTYQLQVAGRGGVPVGATAVVLNVTATEGSGPGYVTVFPCGQPTPLASNLNYEAGTTRPNLTVVKLGTDGKVCLFTATSSVNLIADVAAYFPAA